jgi:hypothetical protein
MWGCGVERKEKKMVWCRGPNDMWGCGVERKEKKKKKFY